MHRLPAPLADAVREVLAPYPARQVAAAARQLSDRYLADHPAAQPILDSGLRAAAYVLTRMPATFAAVRAALEEVALAVPALAPRRVLDLGSGTGAASWAARDTFDGVTHLDLVDYSADALRLAERLLAGADARVTTTRRSVGAAGARRAEPGAEPGGDLALCAYVLGELDAPARAAVVAELVATAGTVLVVEPGTPAGYRRVLEAREALLAAGLTLAAPCPHAHTCPLAGRDWCHMGARLERSVAHREAKRGERDFEDEKFSYVAATRLPVLAPAARVLRHPQVRPGHVLLDLCVADGTSRRVTVSKRQGATYRAARRAAWGDGWDGEPD